MNLQFGIFITEKDLSLHCRKIPDKGLHIKVHLGYQTFMILSTALREQIYFKPIYNYCIVHDGWTISF